MHSNINILRSLRSACYYFSTGDFYIVTRFYSSRLFLCALVEYNGYQHHKPDQTVKACGVGKDFHLHTCFPRLVPPLYLLSRLVPPLYLLSRLVPHLYFPLPLERPTSEAKMAWGYFILLSITAPQAAHTS